LASLAVHTSTPPRAWGSITEKLPECGVSTRKMALYEVNT
jgi:hypothetical protein